ncbi:hypothetical protein C8R44DRAFT_738223 [Mycena epipterygia]|nr:hypothetical protein C8R44DRAFT_738223 [Mycena epipterygia]
MSESSQIAYTNRSLNKKLKPELQAIASAMGQDPKQSVLLLRECIQKYMTVHPEAADDPKFLPLFAHRSAPKGVVKNSADKVAEEVAASSGPLQRLQLEPPRAPSQNRSAPSFAALSRENKPKSVAKGSVNDGQDVGSDLSSSDEGSRVGSPMPEATPKVEVKPKKVKVVATEPAFWLRSDWLSDFGLGEGSGSR